ncbi:hypothetical protein [Pseudaestuariivita rosea]|uniref:hypothetical protein n=1 Tax=Pseudaestuariivita rosea TaxID=2763263 RepID=UPI001ABAB642|nr:hypothetical protein [Pseudaestuariivita rosea]
MYKTTLCAIALGILTGCGSLSPAGMIAASRLDPLETPPADISVAVSVPKVVRLRDGDAELTLSFTPASGRAGDTVLAQVPLTVTATADGPRAPAADEAIYVFGFNADAANALSVAQDRIKGLRARGVEGKGSLSIGVTGGCLTAPLPGALPVATWLRTGDDAFVPLTRPTDMLQALQPEDRDLLIQGLQPC